MTLAVSASVRLRAIPDAVELLSGSCGACSVCRRGHADHCLSPGDWQVSARWSGRSAGQPDLRACAAAIRTVEALAHASAGERVGLVGSGVVLDVVGAVLAGSAVVTVAEPLGAERDREEVRRLSTILRAAPSRRPPDVVVALDGDLRLAGLLVRRGGAVVCPVPVQAAMPMTALVQRELTIVPTHDSASRAVESPLLAALAGHERQEAAA